jgi:TRAP transporter TAXI family solute receptor
MRRFFARLVPRIGQVKRGLGIGGAALAVMLTAAAVFSLLPAPGPKAADEELRYFRIGTGATGASYFTIGALIANAISNPPGSRDCDRGGSCGVPGLIAVAQTTQGSVENIEAIRSGTLESGLSQADIAYWAFTGDKHFKKEGPNENLRAIANLYQEGLHVIVRADSAMESIADLKGKRVASGEKGSGSLVTARLVLEAYGLSEKRIKPEYLALSPAIDRLRDGSLDAIMLIGGSPLPAVADLAESVPIRLIPVDGEPAQKLRQTYPFLTVDVVPTDTYRDVPSVVTLGVGALWVVSADLDAELVYGITRALWHKSTRKLLDEGSPLGRKIRMETALTGIPIPLHPGAERFYTELNQAPPPAALQ